VANRKTIVEFIKEAKDIHGSLYDYSKSKYVNARTKVIIICLEHGEFQQRPTSHLTGYGCPSCARKKTITAKTKTTEQFIKEGIS